MTNEKTDYDIADIRGLLREAVDAKDIRRICEDRPELRPICNKFGPGHGKDDMIDEVIRYCKQHLLLDILLEEVERFNPKRFAEYHEPHGAGMPPVAPVSPESLPASSPGIPYRLKAYAAYLREHRRGISLVLVLVLAIAVVVLVVIGVMNYLEQRQTPQFWTERFLGTKSADVRIVSLVRLVDVTGREEDARSLFFEKLTAAEQVAMFSVSDPEGLIQDLVVVIKILYVKLDNSPKSNSILEAMSEALPERSHLPAGVATELSLELEYWRRGRRSQGEGDYLSAVDSYMLAIGQNEANPSARVDLASAYAALERHPDALDELGRVLQLDPDQRNAVEQVVNADEGLYTYLGLHRPRYRDIAEFFPTLTPTPTPTYTPTPTSTPTPTPTSTPEPTSTPTYTPTPTPTPSPTAEESKSKLEFIAYGEIACGGIAPIPGCVYTLQEWVGTEGPISPGEPIKVLFMNPKSGDGIDIESCNGYYVDSAAYDWSQTPLRVRVRGEPCDFEPSYLFCVCDPEDFVRLEDGP